MDQRVKCAAQHFLAIQTLISAFIPLLAAAARFKNMRRRQREDVLARVREIEKVNPFEPASKLSVLQLQQLQQLLQLLQLLLLLLLLLQLLQPMHLKLA